MPVSSVASDWPPTSLHPRCFCLAYRLRPIMLKNLPIMLLSIAQKIAHYAQNYAHVKELCLKSDCSIRVYLLVSKNYLIW